MYIAIMSGLTVETCCFIRRRLIGLQTNSDGVVPQERKSFEWGWLERALGPQNGPLDAIASWVQMLPTTRVALCRFVTPPKNSPPDYVCIATLVLERNQYAWLSTRLRTALADESFWNATDFAAGTALHLPNWKIDAPLTATQKKAIIDLAKLGAAKKTAIANQHSAIDLHTLVLGLPSLLNSDQLSQVQWSVGLPVAFPNTLVASLAVAPALGAFTHQDQRSSSALGVPKAPPAIPFRSSSHPPPPLGVITPPPTIPLGLLSSPISEQPFNSTESWTVSMRKPQSTFGLIPVACLLVIAGTLAVAVWIMKYSPLLLH